MRCNYADIASQKHCTTFTKYSGMVLVKLDYVISVGGQNKIRSLNYICFERYLQKAIDFAPSGWIERTWSDISSDEAEALKTHKMHFVTFSLWRVNTYNCEIVKYFKLLEQTEQANQELKENIL